METNKLKIFAQAARRQLLDQVATRLEQVLRADSVETREKKAAITELRQQIASSSKQAVIDRVAYTWFNRFCALRFMDVNYYTRLGIVSPQEGYTQPEILQEAKQGVIDDEFKVDRQRILDILGNKIPSSDPQGEAYRLLLVGACNAYHQLMPFLFEPIADYTELLMPDDLLSENSVLHKIRQALTEETCQDVEVIGWLYQFYISERKDEVFENLKRNIKIEARDIPAATQLFTPHWIVRYLVENSLGRLWMLNHPDSKLIEQMEYYIKPEQDETDYIRIETPEEIKMCDPACGSGHMLTYAFDLLHAIYEEQGYDSTQTPRLILQKNLYGIEIDTRAGDLAAFALVMKARAKDRRFFSREVEPNICVLQNLSFTNREIEEYMGVVGRDLFTQDLQVTLGQFEQADNFGSLIRPQLKDVSFIRGRLEKRKVFENLFLHSTNHKVQQVLMQVEYLAPRYHVAVTNPPYMGAAGMNEELKRFALENYPESKADAYSMFIERNLELVVYEGMVGMITIPNWMFLSYFDDIRKRLIRDHVIVSLVHNGRGVFGSDFGSCSFVISKQANKDYLGTFKRLFVKQGEVNSNDVLIQRFFDIQDFPNFNASSSSFTKIPGSPIAYWVTRTDLFSGPKIGDFFLPGGRNKTHDNAMYLRYFWEISSRNDKWKLYSNGGDFRKYFGNDIYVINWSQEARDFYESQGGLLNSKYWYKLGITWNLVTISKPSFRIKLEKNFYSSGSPTIFTQDYSCDYKALGFLNSPISIYYLQAINPTVNTTIGNVFSLPYNGDAINSVVITNVERCIEIAKSDWDSFEISIDFSTHPILSNKYPTPLVSESYEAVRSNWEILIRETERLEYENNQIYTESYGLQNVLFSGVPLEEITLTCNPHYRYGSKKNESKLEALLLTDTMKDFISYSIGCMFGRYSLNKPGLILANQGETTQDYYKHIPQPSFPPDEDNVIPILEAGWFNDDITERFKKFLRVTFGDEYYEENLAFIENAIGRDIRSYFLKDFYGEHVKMYKNRPIYWLFSSPNGSFNALIYMHRYRPDTVSVVLNDYLREYVRKLNSHKAHLEQVSLRTGGSQAENAKATREINALNKILAELKDYEDEVLYPLATRQIQIDLDDGVKVNYAKFGKAVRTVKGL